MTIAMTAVVVNVGILLTIKNMLKTTKRVVNAIVRFYLFIQVYKYIQWVLNFFVWLCIQIKSLSGITKDCILGGHW